MNFREHSTDTNTHQQGLRALVILHPHHTWDHSPVIFFFFLIASAFQILLDLFIYLFLWLYLLHI